MSKRKLRIDRRLIGTWKSDRRMTFRHFTPKRGATPQQLRKFKSLFGKLTVRYGTQYFHEEMDGSKFRTKYELLAQDSETVVVRFYDTLREEARVVQIHFEKDHYWIWAWGMREFFKRVSPPRRRGSKS
jgi:hypothetical protein